MRRALNSHLFLTERPDNNDMNTIKQTGAPVTTRASRLCLVTETWPPEINGVAMTLSRLMTGLSAMGWQITIVRPRQKSDATSDAIDGIEHWLVPGLPIPGYQGLRFGLPMLEKLRQSWREKRPDVVHVATEGPLGWAALKVARLLNIPVTSSFHTNFHRYCKHYHVGWLRGLVMRHLRGFHNQTYMTMVPNALQQAVLQDDGYQNVVVLGRGVDTQLFSPARRSESLRRAWALREDEIAVLHVGRMASEKNLSGVIEAYEAMRRLLPTARMVWVGDGPQLKRLQRHHPDHIFCGSKTGEALAEHYASADVFLFASLTETFGNVVTEAMASGLPVVAYDYAAANLFVRHGVNGMLAPVGDQATFCHMAATLANKQGHLRVMGRAARLAVEPCGWTTITAQLDHWLREAIESSVRVSASAEIQNNLGRLAANSSNCHKYCK